MVDAYRGKHAEFSGPIDVTMNACLGRHGTWIPASRCWRVPLNKGSTLARSVKRAAGPAATEARVQRDIERRRADAIR